MDNFAANKDHKDKANNLIQANTAEQMESNSNNTLSPETEGILLNHLDNKSFQKIKDIYEKTQEMSQIAKEKNRKLEEEFVNLKQRLSASSECLLRVKKNIENVKFSYQKNLMQMHNALEPGDCFDSQINQYQSKDDMDKRIEEIRQKIEKLQNKVACQKEKHDNVIESYQEVFQKVSETLENIDKGTYSSLHQHKANDETN